MGLFSNGLKNEFETAVVNEPSVFEPLKFYCIKAAAVSVLGNQSSSERFVEKKMCINIRNPGRDISFPIFIRKEIETRKLERKSKQKYLV